MRRVRCEHHPGRGLEDDSHLGDPLSNILAGPDKERDARPAPVVNLESHRGESLGLRSGAHPGHRQVPVVLPANVVARVGRRDGAEHLQPLVTQTVGVGRARRLGRDQPNDLQQVVLYDVTKRSSRVTWTLWMRSRFQSGSKTELANRRYRMSIVGSLPRKWSIR